MCTITKILKKPKKAKGYKLAIKNNNKYFSPINRFRIQSRNGIP